MPVAVLTEDEADAKEALRLKQDKEGVMSIDYEFDVEGYPNTFRKFSTEGLATTPGEQEMLDMFVELIKGCNIYSAVRRWRPLMVCYTSALENWDDVTGGQEFETEEEFVNPTTWLKEQHAYHECFRSIDRFVGHSFTSIRDFVQDSAEIVELFFRVQYTDDQKVA